jgi:predicted nucleic acid-binding protein
MIVVDTTVWIDHLNDTPTPQVIRLRDIITNRFALLVVGDLVLCEVLQGLSNEREAALVERALRRFVMEAMVNPSLASRSAANYRALRARGITVRKTMDMLIGTYCIEHGHALLHSDRDFDPMETHLGLSVVHP